MYYNDDPDEAEVRAYEAKMSLLEPWRLAADLSFSAAAMLCAHINPSDYSGRAYDLINGTDGYRGMCAGAKPYFEALRSAALADPPGFQCKIVFEADPRWIAGIDQLKEQAYWQGRDVHLCTSKTGDEFVVQAEPDWDRSTINVESMKRWMASRGFTTGFFFPPSDAPPDYANSTSEHYAPDLAAAVAAWVAVSGDPAAVRGRKPKQAMVAWLKKNGDRYGLLDDDGNPREKRIGEIAALANWDKSPGAAKTPDSSPD